VVGTTYENISSHGQERDNCTEECTTCCKCSANSQHTLSLTRKKLSANREIFRISPALAMGSVSTIAAFAERRIQFAARVAVAVQLLARTDFPISLSLNPPTVMKPTLMTRIGKLTLAFNMYNDFC
jgi:hypothetical protein